MRFLTDKGRLGYLALTAVVILSTLLAACAAPAPTQSPQASPPGSPAASPATQPTAVKPAAQQTPAVNLAKEQVFRFNLLGDPNSIDPGLDQSTNQETVIKQLWTGLVRYKPDLTVEPALAEKWDVSSDGKTYTFTLKDTKWSDGSPVTAADFEYSIKRMLDPKFASPYAHFLVDLKGAEEYNNALGTKEKPKQASDADLARLRDAVGVKAIDAKTLRFELANAASYFLSLAAQGNMSPIKKDVVDKFGDKWTQPENIVSNGPFILKSWTTGSKMILERNPNYFDKKPTLERIELTFIDDDATAFAAYQKNELDISHSIPDAQVPQIRQDAKLSKEILQDNQLTTYYLGYNIKQKPFDDKRVRQAFQMGVDFKTLNEKVLSGISRPAKSFIPPGMPGHQPEIGFDFNPAQAKKLLADAGYPDGKGFPKVTMVYNTSTGHKLRMEFIQAQIKENLGLDLGLENWESRTYFEKLASETPAVYRAGWNSDYPHPNDWLRVVWESTSELNWGQWANQEFDDLVRRAAAETDLKKQLDLYAQAQKILVEEAPAMWVYFYGRFRLVKPWVKGLVVTPQDPSIGAYFWKDIQIESH